MKATAYIQLEPRLSYSGRLLDVKIVRMTQNKPTTPFSGNTKVVKVELNIPEELWKDIELKVSIPVPVPEQQEVTVRTVELGVPEQPTIEGEVDQ